MRQGPVQKGRRTVQNLSEQEQTPVKEAQTPPEQMSLAQTD